MPAERAARAHQHARRARRVQRELARPGAALAADDRSPVRQGDRRDDRHGAGAVSGRVQRRCWSRRLDLGDGRPPHALEAVGADRVVAVSPRRRALRRRIMPALVQGVPLQTWVFPQDRDAGRAVFEETSRRAMDFFSDAHRPVSVREARQRAGRRATAAAWRTRRRSSTARRASRRAASPVVHEIAHQWFGNSVTERDWDDVWLSEGFATYFALLYTEQFEGRDAFVDGLQRSRADDSRAREEAARHAGRASQPERHGAAC